MSPLLLHEFHAGLGARFVDVNGCEMVSDYGDSPLEHAALLCSVGVLDLSCRSRVCLTGGDRVKFLHGQVTNDVQKLRAGEGCYAALITAKGRMQSDLFIYSLANEILLDFEPGLARPVMERLEKYIIADDVQLVDVEPHYALLSAQGPKAKAAVEQLDLGVSLPEMPLQFVSSQVPDIGEIYVVNQPRPWRQWLIG